MPHALGSNRIFFTGRLGPNFLWHMLAVGGIGYDSDYADRYRETVMPEDRDQLKRRRELLWFEGGRGGELGPMFSTFPGWLHVETEQDFAAYFQALADVYQARNYAPMRKAFPHVDWADPMVGPSIEYHEWPDNSATLVSTINRLGDIYLRSYDRYVTGVWPDALAAMQPRIDDLDRHFTPQDYIALWEREFKLCFRAEAYEIVLCYANENGPDYNSLGYNGNLFYYDKPFDRTWQMVSHEIGTHILIDSFLSLALTGEYDESKLYGAYEVMAMFFNRRILGLDSLAYELPYFNDAALLDFYEETYRRGMPAGDLLRLAAERFCPADISPETR